MPPPMTMRGAMWASLPTALRDKSQLTNHKEDPMERYELPPRPEGTTEQQLTQLWEALFRLVERLNAEKKGV